MGFYIPFCSLFLCVSLRFFAFLFGAGFVRAAKKKEYLVLVMAVTRCHFYTVHRYRKIPRYLAEI